MSRVRLTRTRAAGDEHVQATLDDSAQEFDDFGRERPVFDEIFDRQGVGPKPANRHRRPIESERRNDHVHARSIGEPRVDQRRGFVDSSPHGGYDLVDDAHQVSVVPEAGDRLLDLAAPFDEDVTATVDQDVRNRRILEQWLERAEAEDFVLNLLHEALSLLQRQQELLFFENLDRCGRDVRADPLLADGRNSTEVDHFEQSIVDPRLQILVQRISRGRR